MTTPLAAALGRYEGEGTWRDETGECQNYAVEMTLSARDSDGLTIAYRHVFAEDDVPDVAVSIDLICDAPCILSFEFPGLPVKGRGYYSGDLLHYTIPIPGNAVEVTLFFTADGARLAGSSQKNSAGRYIMWEERLDKTA